MMAGFLAVLVYDRVVAHNREAERRQAAGQKQTSDDLSRCEEPILANPSPSPSATQQALADCKRIILGGDVDPFEKLGAVKAESPWAHIAEDIVAAHAA